MNREKIIELANLSGLRWIQEISAFKMEENGLNKAAEIPLKLFASLVEQETLEMIAKHFDERGRHIDGGWSEGWYEPSEPGEIIRGMINNRVQ